MNYLDFEKLVLYEDNHLLIVNKPSGMLVQPDKLRSEKSLEELAKEYIKIKEQKPGDAFLGIPHRIDRPTSGIVLLCKSSKALVRINDMFQKKKIQKTYWATTDKADIQQKGHLTHYLKRSTKENISLVSDTAKADYKEAKLSYQVLAQGKTMMLLEIQLHTGRHHQIRAQFSHINLPLVGDNKYGYKRNLPDRSIALHAQKISFLHPVGQQPIEIEAPICKNSIFAIFFENKI